MAIVKMKKIRLLVSRADKEDVLRELMLLGRVEVSEPDVLLEDPELAAFVERENAELDRCRADYASLARALEVINEHVPIKTKMFAQRPEVTDSRKQKKKEAEKSLELAKTLDSLDNDIRRLLTEENNEKNLIESLTPWAPLELLMNNEGTNTAAVILGAVASTVDIDMMQYTLHEAVRESQAFVVSSNAEQHYLCVVCLRDKQSAASEVLRRYNFSVTSLKSIECTAEESIKNAEKHLLELAEEKEDLTAQIKAAAEKKPELQLCYDHIGTKIARAEAAEKLLGTQSSLLLTGWAAAPAEPDIVSILSKYTCAWSFEDPSRDEYGAVPVELNNGALARPLTMVTEMYSLPAYGGIDPNPLMMPFFVAFYGCMMADMGYGLVMIIAALIVRSKKPQGGMKTLFDLMFPCGIATFIVGAMTGGLFGDTPTQLAKLFTGNEGFILYKPLFDPITNTMEVLIGALVLGFLHIIFGMGIKMFMKIRDGKALDGILDVVPWWLLFAGIALGALGVTWIVAIAGGAALILTQGRAKPTIVGKLIGGIASLYDITSYFGDILSYSRVMALMLAGGVIAMVFNTLGALT
ncbi:MAG: hypothetical protein LBH28_08250, partial [Oscillospiraceae bacterium]|nr:hypothetical protein [Oscillospiraceae bacterium]